MKSLWILGLILGLGACGVKGAPMPKKESEYIRPSRLEPSEQTSALQKNKTEDKEETNED